MERLGFGRIYIFTNETQVTQPTYASLVWMDSSEVDSATNANVVTASLQIAVDRTECVHCVWYLIVTDINHARINGLDKESHAAYPVVVGTGV